MPAYIYIMTNKPYGVLYIGVTTDIARRVYEHKNHLLAGFTARYKLHQLVYVEQHDEIETAILREKQMKKWQRMWKLNLIQQANPAWDDLTVF